MLYAPNVVMQSHGYDGPDAVIQALIPDADGSGVEVQAEDMADRTLEYGYSYDRNADHVVLWQTDHYFSDLKPDQYYFFARVKAEGGQDAGGLSEPVPYLVKTPSPVSQEMVPSLSLGTEVFHPDREQYIWYGTDYGADGSGLAAPILWRVLETETESSESEMLLLSDRLFGSGESGGLNFSDRPPYDQRYQGSAVQQWCEDFELSRMTLQEQEAIQSTTKSDGMYSSQANGGVTFGAQTETLSHDKVFLPSAEEILTALDTTQARQGWYHGDY